MSRRRPGLCANAVLAAALVAATTATLSAGVMQYTVTDLGTLGGYTRSYARAVNDLGQVVGRVLTDTGQERAFLWESGVMTDLGTLGGPQSYASDINNLGQVVGGAATPGAYHAFLWDNGVMTDLGAPFPGGERSHAYGIDEQGRVVGMAETTLQRYLAFRWEDGVMSSLGTLPDGQHSVARAINDAGQIAGSSEIYNYTTEHAFLWTSTAGMIDLGTLGGYSSQGYDINGAGQVVGASQVGTPGQPWHAFLWESGGPMTDLGTLDGYTRSYAYAVNDLGQVVGRAQTDTGEDRAFLWEGGVMTDLNDLIDPGSGWVLLEAWDINESGWIVGYGSNPAGETHGFLLVPEPGALSLLMLGLRVCGGRSRRARCR